MVLWETDLHVNHRERTHEVTILSPHTLSGGFGIQSKS